MYYVYLLESKKYNEIYVGSTGDLQRRFKEHNEGKNISTKRYAPWALVSYEAYQSEEDARYREKMLKQHGNAMRQFKIKSRNSFLKKEKGSPSTIFLPKKNSAGFTLLETLIYIFIIGSVFVSFVSLTLSISKTRNKNYAVVEVQANVRVALETLEQKIRLASSVVSPAANVSSTQLVLGMGSNPNITFFVVTGTLQMAQTGSSTVVITDTRTTVSDLKFTNLSVSGERGNILIEMTIAYKTATGDTEYGYSQTVRSAISLRK